MEIISTFKEIAYNYMFKDKFFLDLISILPLQLFFKEMDFNMLRLIRLIRFPKLIDLLKYKNVEKLIDIILSNSKNRNLNILHHIKYAFKICRLIIIAITLTYFVGCFWFLFCNRISKSQHKDNFIDYYDLDDKSLYERLVLSSYYAISTLTTVGYGDYIPRNNLERLFSIFIMLLGVAMFSYVMGNFTNLIASKEMNQNSRVNKITELQKWYGILNSYSNNKLFNSNLINTIDKHYSNLWHSDRNQYIKKNDFYFRTLPRELKVKMMYWLWEDIFERFSNFFIFNNINREKFSDFYYNIAFHLHPRK
jgi:hypothetical protein